MKARVSVALSLMAMMPSISFGGDGMAGGSIAGNEKPRVKPADGKDKGKMSETKSIYDFTVKDIDGKDVALSKYKGDVLLIVNVASKWGLTNSSYSGLESLFAKYNDKGLRVLAFPANNFNSQEPGTNAEIKTFCRTTKKATFDLFAKVSVKGDDICPLYQYLTHHSDKDIAGDVVWNFQKYLVDRRGHVIGKFHPKTLPEDKEIVSKLESALEEKPG